MLIPLDDTMYPRNKLHLDENDIFLGWQRANISKVGLETSVQPHHVAVLDLWYRSIYYPGIQ